MKQNTLHVGSGQRIILGNVFNWGCNDRDNGKCIGMKATVSSIDMLSRLYVAARFARL